MKHAAHSFSTFRVATKVATLALGLSLTGQVLAASAQQMLLFGNSLTKHGPASAIGWDGDWGMAASTADKDYASQLNKLLSQGKQHASWQVRRESAGGLEGAPGQYRIPDDLSRQAGQARLVVIQAGDNFDPNKLPLAEFAQGYERVTKALRPRQGTLACVSTWWPSAEKDKIIQAACARAGGVFVDISDIARTQGNIARNERAFKHEGVGSHPGDAGMKAIAQRIQRSLQAHSKEWRQQ